MKELIEKLSEDDLFKQWQQDNAESFLSHLFCPLSADFQLKSNWEIGYHSNDKITVFVANQNGFEIKPADDVFKKQDAKVEPLKLDEVKLSFVQALDILKEELPKSFPGALLGDGFIILQTYQEKTVWNFTFITKQLKFVNMKLNAGTGEVEDSQEIDLVQK
ncbi:PepSY domain-containing protein [Candidatus Woesearchaeota archaeon]|jgi:hypothetical protein|nr:PepSY domain-containing protein [Candidatus Woesearchaeota archaeon]MBT4111194.1 PepSY domain-containing protein [Candidatus Woesearchaeota archaeon]MBT4336774.1 PepSY domain-containing protein [Candidatus Woesearchaeota archaeon]MBT4469442.1 PepSY domain-containing protein [Candidatus Woesearchaeota archaeon]MBT6744163.1 PepSY domain-containing protein [Candidatus Woesearchaeota archaeon]